MPPTECINCGTRHVPSILALTIRPTTAAPHHLLHQHQSIHPPAVSACSIKYTAPQHIHLHSQGTFLLFHADCLAHSTLLVPGVNSFFLFQMVALNFECILLMLKDRGSILRDTLQSQDRINLGDICFCPLLRTLHMQCISLGSLCTLLSEGTLVPP